MTDDDMSASLAKRNSITPGEDLSHLSLDDLAERRSLLEAELRRIDEITDKKRAGLDAAEAVFKI